MPRTLRTLAIEAGERASSVEGSRQRGRVVAANETVAGYLAALGVGSGFFSSRSSRGLKIESYL
jgi:hypothetical protein